MATSTQTITAENVIRLFPDVNPSLAGAHKVPQDDRDLAGYDEEQIRLMEEVCIVLDENDVPIGSASKKVCMFDQEQKVLLEHLIDPSYRPFDEEYRRRTATSRLLCLSLQL